MAQLNIKTIFVSTVLVSTVMVALMESAQASTQDLEARRDELIEDYAEETGSDGLGDFGLGEVIGEIQSGLESLTDLGGLFGEFLGGEGEGFRDDLVNVLEDSGITGLYEDISDFVVDVGSYINDDIWGTVQDAMGMDLEGDIFGVLGLPQPSEIESEIEGMINTASDEDSEANSNSHLRLSANAEGYGEPNQSFSLEDRMKALEERETARSRRSRSK